MDLGDNDIIDISLDDMDNIGHNSKRSGSGSVSPIPMGFDDGIDLLINKKKLSTKSSVSGSGSTSSHARDSDDGPKSSASDFVRVGDVDTGDKYQSVKSLGQDSNSGTIDIGHSTASLHEHSNTWDGFGKLEPNVHFNSDSHTSSASIKPNTRAEQIKYWKKLERLRKKGIMISRDYTSDSPLEEMKTEYNSIVNEQKRDSAVRFQQNCLSTFVSGLQWASEKWDIANLDGLSDQVTENIGDYDDIFEEMHEMYLEDSGSYHPAVRLVAQLGGSMMMVHMMNTMFNTSGVPGIEDVLRQDPALMNAFQSAAIRTMSQNAPGMSNFLQSTNEHSNQPHVAATSSPASNIRTASSRTAPSYNTVPNGSGPPPPIRVRSSDMPPPPPDRGGNKTYRPDLDASAPVARSMRPEMKAPRAEMRGPGDISDILGNSRGASNIRLANKDTDDISTISIQEARELSGEVQLPKQTKRRAGSAKNTASIDI